jgi:hypothetical protein
LNAICERDGRSRDKKVLDYPFAAKDCVAVNNYKTRALVLLTTSSSSSVVALLRIVSRVFFHAAGAIFKLELLLFEHKLDKLFFYSSKMNHWYVGLPLLPPSFHF